ncbi:MAG: hypothetical protein AAB250_07125 [Bdellovibrionota bacterium]
MVLILGALIIQLVAADLRAACSSPVASIGAMDFQTSTWKYCDGTTWQSFGGSTTFPLQGSAGSASTPTYSFSTSTNTGLFSSGAGTLALATAGQQQLTIDSSGNVGIGTTSPAEKLSVVGNVTATGQVVSAQNVVSSGATVDFSTGNVQIVQSPGGAAITLNNMKDGGSYTVIVTDTTVRTYTFTNCTNSHFVPTNAATESGSQTIYTILKATISSATHCYISWITGF